MKRVFYIQIDNDEHGVPSLAKAIEDTPLDEPNILGDGAAAHAFRQLKETQRYLDGWDVIGCDFPNGQEVAMVIEENGAINSIYVSMEIA